MLSPSKLQQWGKFPPALQRLHVFRGVRAAGCTAQCPTTLAEFSCLIMSSWQIKEHQIILRVQLCIQHTLACM